MWTPGSLLLREKRSYLNDRLSGLVFAVPLLFGTVALQGQTVADSERFISTDRPSVANSSIVVPKGDLQLENGLLMTNIQGQYILDFPESALRFGLLNKTELRLSIPDYFYTLSSETASASGFGDITIGVKQQVGPTGGNFDLSVILFLSLPSGGNSVWSHGYDPGLQLPWATYWPTQAGKHNFTGEATFLLDRQLTKLWDAFIEYAGDFPSAVDHTSCCISETRINLLPDTRSTSKWRRGYPGQHPICLSGLATRSCFALRSRLRARLSWLATAI